MILLSATTAIAQTRSDSIRTRFLNGNGKDVLVVCHRGDWRGYAENSLEGINSAINMGVDVVEIDLRRTADGELILMHDSRIDRSTTGKGKVAELTLDSIKNVYLRSGVGERTPYRVPTLKEVLVAVKGRVMLNLDKAADYFDQVWQLAEETGTTSQIIMKSTAPAADIKAKYGQYLDSLI
ncbi:MAG: glycerophosphodiester phosphodiesterase family protein, partial [Bacteroides sp.]|nr:glycerophosphodiester phosphodiesterase family protein [Bacteroides sp.]